MLFLNNSATWLNICIIYIKWENILGRKERLQESHQLQLFKANQRLVLDWTLKQSDEMVKKGLPKNKTEAESFILEHQNWKVLKYIYLHYSIIQCLSSCDHDYFPMSTFFSQIAVVLCVLIFFCHKIQC